MLLGSAFGLAFTVVFYFACGRMKFKEMMDCIPEGFKAMVPCHDPTFAWSRSAATTLAREFAAAVVKNSATGFQILLPAIVFVIGLLSLPLARLGVPSVS